MVTDPPYLTRYRDRSGRTVINDDRSNWVRPAFGEVHRLLKPDTFCISFYGWNHVETFMHAWKEAGFRPVGHIVWRKHYASRTGFLQSRHESATSWATFWQGRSRPWPNRQRTPLRKR